MFDVLFQNATIIDGTGAPRYTGSIGVKDGLIHPAPADSPARRVIDARGKILSPGFIDPHSHGDMIVGNDFAREAKTTQGITTEVAGMCGATFFPFLPGPKGNRDGFQNRSGEPPGRQGHLYQRRSLLPLRGAGGEKLQHDPFHRP